MTRDDYILDSLAKRVAALEASWPPGDESIARRFDRLEKQVRELELLIRQLVGGGR